MQEVEGHSKDGRKAISLGIELKLDIIMGLLKEPVVCRQMIRECERMCNLSSEKDETSEVLYDDDMASSRFSIMVTEGDVQQIPSTGIVFLKVPRSCCNDSMYDGGCEMGQ